MADRPRWEATGALADLARAGYRLLDTPTMQVDLEIRHGVDTPGGLAGVLGALPEEATFTETMCAGANGVGVLAGTRLGDQAEPHGPRGPWLDLVDWEDDEAVFRGADRPDLAFRDEAGDRMEGIVVVEDEPRKLLLRHGLAILDALVHIAETALRAGDAPLLVLQCPAQLPPTNTYQASSTSSRVIEPARSSSVAIRFAITLERPGAEVRLQIADALARYCGERGLGLWLGDTRSGYRPGNWFSVLRHDRPRARRRYSRAADRPRSSGNAAEGCVPVTLVGPARPGSTHAILAFLGQFPEVGVLGCTMMSLAGLTFLHLQLTVNGASHPRLTAVNGALFELADLGAAGPEEYLRRLIPLLLREGETSAANAEQIERLVSRAGDYQVAAGPAVLVPAANVLRRIPVWVAWQLREVGGGVRVVVPALQRAIDLLDLTDPQATSEPAGRPTFEYLACRETGVRLRGKAKLAVSKNLVERRFPAASHMPGRPSATARLCAELLDLWATEMAAAGHEVRPGELAVSPHEAWL